MSIVFNYIGIILIVIGIFLIVTATVGVLRFPDFFTRLHPAGIADSLGSASILIGLILQHSFSMFSIKVLLLISFLWITGTTSAHALAYSAYYNKKKK